MLSRSSKHSDDEGSIGVFEYGGALYEVVRQPDGSILTNYLGPAEKILKESGNGE